MTTLERLEAWRRSGVITSEQHASLAYHFRRDWQVALSRQKDGQTFVVT